MLQAFFHAWERQLASVTKDRVVRPFEWGLDWIPANGLPPTAPPERILSDWVAHVMADTDAFFTPAPTNDYRLTDAGPDGDRPLTFPSALDNAAAREQHRLLPCLSDRGRGATRRARPSLGAAAVELGSRRARGPVPAPGDERHDRAASEPAVSRSADAAGAAARRLHRQLERRAHRAGVPAGRARRATGDRLARRRRLRAHRHSRHEPRLLSVAADDGARTADRGAGAQPHLSSFRGRRLAGALDAPRSGGARRAHRPRAAAGACGSRSARTGTSIACAIGGRCSSTRATI